MLQRRTHAGVHHQGRGGEDDAVALFDHAVDFVVKLILRGGDAHGGLHLVAQRVFAVDAAQLVPVVPAGVLNGPVIDERRLHPGRAEQRAEKAAAVRLGAIHDKAYGLGLHAALEVILQAANVGGDFGGGLALGFLIAEHVQVEQKRVRHGNGRVVAVFRLILVSEVQIGAAKIHAILARPFFARRVAGFFDQFIVFARLREDNRVESAVLFEIDELEIGAVFPRALWQNARDLGLHEHGVEVFHDADALVALHQIVLVHVFEHGDRLAHAVGEHAFIQVDPLDGELAVRLEQRHEVGRERVGACARRRADHAVQRNLHDAQRNARERLFLRHQLVQHGKVWLFMRLQTGVIGAQTHFPRAVIDIRYDHDMPLLIRRSFSLKRKTRPEPDRERFARGR